MFKIFTKYYTNDIKCKEDYQGIYILFIKIKEYGIGWFTDCGDWFFYIYLGKHGVRFSSAGFLTY